MISELKTNNYDRNLLESIADQIRHLRHLAESGREERRRSESRSAWQVQQAIRR